MEYLLLIFIGLLAFDTLSGLQETRARWREVRTGRAGIHTLRMLTGIWDREELSRHFGTPDPTFHYEVTREQVLSARTRARRIFDQKAIGAVLLGIAMLAGGIIFFQPSSGIAWSIICTAFLYLAFRSGHNLLLLARSYRQMLEEGRAKLHYVRNQAR
jgi:hypothetical protein